MWRQRNGASGLLNGPVAPVVRQWAIGVSSPSQGVFNNLVIPFGIQIASALRERGMRGKAAAKLLRPTRHVVAVAAVASALSACASLQPTPAHLTPLPNETAMLLGKKRMEVQAPI